MKRKPALLLTMCLFVILSSCSRSHTISPNPVNDSSLLTGWWAPVNTAVQAKLYFGTDNFFYNDTVKQQPPLAGFWHLNGNNIIYRPAMLGTPTQRYEIEQISATKLQLKIIGTGVIQSFTKTSLPAITSPAMASIAGTGNPGISGDGGPATTADIEGDAGIVVDNAGNIYFCDEVNIRKISASDGTISTIAGTGIRATSTFPPDNVLATSANLSTPSFITIDAAGNVYFTDTGFSVIYEISAASRMLIRIAGTGVKGFTGDGGPATSAKLNQPGGITFDAAGNLLIADFNNKRIRKVSVTTGFISTIAGNGTTSYSGDGGPAIAAGLSPMDLSLDASGNIYFSDFAHSLVRKITASTEIITTIAGSYPNHNKNGTGDGGPAIDATIKLAYGIRATPGGDVYIADVSDNNIRKIDNATGIITRVAGTGYMAASVGGIHATAYSLYNPRSVTTDAAGNLYIGDASHRMHKVNAN